MGQALISRRGSSKGEGVVIVYMPVPPSYDVKSTVSVGTGLFTTKRQKLGVDYTASGTDVPLANNLFVGTSLSQRIRQKLFVEV